MRLKWFLVAFLCVTLLHSACVVRAQHEDYVEEEEETNVQDVADAGDEGTAGEDLMESPVVEESEDPPEPADDPPPPEEAIEEEQEPQTEDVETIETHQESTDDVEVDTQPKIGSRKSGNYYFDDDYYNSNYDVDINYDWSKFKGSSGSFGKQEIEEKAGVSKSFEKFTGKIDELA